MITNGRYHPYPAHDIIHWPVSVHLAIGLCVRMGAESLLDICSRVYYCGIDRQKIVINFVP